MNKSSLHPLYGWLFFINTGSLLYWNFGPTIFIFLLGNLLLLADSYSGVFGRRQLPVINPQRLFITAAILFLPFLLFSFLYTPEWVVDIAANTDAAVKHLIEGRNPYTHKGQLWVEHFSSPNVTVEKDQVMMFGVPYYYGFPYFPAMAISYIPMTALLDSFTGLRLTNLFLFLLNYQVIHILLRMHSHSKEQCRRGRKILFLMMVLAPAYIFNTIYLGITDILVSTYLLVSLLFIARKEFLLAGIMLGLAQSSKLLPAPFALLAMLFFINHGGNNKRFILGFIVTCAICVLPFLFWNPEGFLSATILYYLTHHQGGDVTSLWFFLPKLIQPAFLWFGLGLSITSIIFLYRKTGAKARGNLPMLAVVIFSSYVIFMGFSKMSHFNYYWCVYPLFCYALAARWSSLTTLSIK